MSPLVIDYVAVARRLLRLERLDLSGTDALARVLQVAEPRQLDGGTVLVAEGDEAHELLVVARGAVRVHLRDASGRPAEVATLRAPLLLGHIAVVDHGKRSATCEMATDGLVLALGHAQIERLLTHTTRGAEVLRDLMLAAMFRQLGHATARLRDYLRAHPDVHIELSDTDPP